MKSLKIASIQLSLIWAALIISSAFYARPLYNSLILLIPRSFIVIGLAVLLIAAACYFIRLINWQVLLVLVLIFSLFLLLDLPEEKIHIFLYAILGILRVKDKPDSTPLNWIIFIVMITLLSEGAQAISPDRVADIRDLFIDAFSGVCGLVIGVRIYRN